MKKVTSLLLCLILVLSIFASVSADDAKINGLITFDGYSARKSDFNGIRAQYTLDTSVLSNLEKDYRVTIGVLAGSDIAEDKYTTDLALGKKVVNKIFYSTDSGYVGTYYDNITTDNKYEFVYAITYSSDEAVASTYYQNPVSMRVYVTLASSNNTETYYINNESSLFGYAVSMNEIASYFVNTATDNYPMLQRVINPALTAAKINNVNIDKFSVVVQSEADIAYGKQISNAVKAATGYSLPVCIATPNSTEAYIVLDNSSALSEDKLYEISANNAVITLKAKTSDAIASAIAKFGEELAKDCVIDTTITEIIIKTYKVTYGESTADSITVKEGEGFTLPVTAKDGYLFLGYFTDDNVQVTDTNGKSLSTYVLSSDITVVAKYKRDTSDAFTATGQLLGNPLKLYYKGTSFLHKMSRVPQDLIVYNGKVYLGGGTYDGGWNSAPPISVYDIESDTWSNADFTVKMYEALDADSTTKKWYELPATKSNSNNVSNQSVGIIPVTTDCEISNFRFIGGKPVALGADSINGNTWANGIVSTNTTTEQKYVANNLGNYYIIEEDENGNERWVEYRNNVLHGTHVYDAVEIDYNGGKTIMFALGTSGALMPVKILKDKATKSYITAKFYLKDGSSYDGVNNNNRVYNLFKTDAGLFAFYAHQGGSAKKIFKYNFTNNEHRFDEVRDITVSTSSSATFKTYVQNDVDKSGAAISSRRLWTDFMRTESFNGYAYITSGTLYKAKTFNDITKITVPNSAIVTDLTVRNGVLYALGFVKTDSTTNAYTNYIWSINANDKFTQLREFNTVGAYALSFDKDDEFFYVGLGGPTTHITTSVANVGNILRLSYEIPPATTKYKVTYDEGKFIEVEEGTSFSLPVVNKDGYTFLGYYTADNAQVTDAEGKSISTYVLSSDITVEAKFQRLPTEADSATGQLLGNPLKLYYKGTSFEHKIGRNPWDLIVYNGKVYIGGGYYGGGWIPAPPMSVYDTTSGTWGNVDFTVKMYEALDPDSTTKKWYELPATKSNSNNVSNQNVGIIPVTTDCEISNFKFINGKPITFGGDSINGNTWADGTVSTSTTTEQKYVANNLGNFYMVEEDSNGNDRWVEYRNSVLHGTHVYDAVEIDYNGQKTLMFAIGGSGGSQLPVKILTNKNTKSYASPKLYLKDGSVYSETATNIHNRVYNFFKTDEGIFAFYSQQGGSLRKIFKYNFTNNEHRFDEVRDVTVSTSSSATFKTYVQNDVDKSGAAVSSRRLWTDFMRTETFNGYAYITSGTLYKAKTFNDITKITVPNSAIITDLIVREGVLYALGFKLTNSTTNAYTNYIWSISSSDKFTEIRNFTSTGAYALSFDKDDEFFYVGLGGPSTHTTTSVMNVGNILKLAINPIQ